MSAVKQALWLRRQDVPPLPNGWVALPTSEACVQLHPGKLYDQYTVKAQGSIPVVSQGAIGFHGYHDEEAGVTATRDRPVVTFANHTCAMRLMKQPFSCIQNIFPKIGKPGICDTVYFYYAAQGRVGLSDYKGHHPLFRQAYIPIPPLVTQTKIAGILCAYDELIENNTRRIKILEEMAKLIYREWFVEFKAPGVKLRKATSEEKKVTGKDVFPERWETKRFSDAVNINPSTPVKKGVPKVYVPMGSLSQNSMLIGETETRDGNNGSKFKNRDVLFARITPCLENGKTGFVQFLPSDDEVAIGSTEFIVFREGRVPAEFIYLTSRLDNFRNNAIKSMSGATGRQRVQERCFDTWKFAVPTDAILKAFIQVVAPLFKTIQVLSDENCNLRQTRDLLLPKLVSGEVEV
jgi:hypothetical protein